MPARGSASGDVTATTLNVEWRLADPQGAVIDAGGSVFIAERGGVVVGTAAIAPHGPGEVELLKVTVADAARGAGLGRRLVDVCIARAEYSVNLDEADFYGAHSNVMRVEATAGGRVSWRVYRTKAAEAIPTAVRAGVFQL